MKILHVGPVDYTYKAAGPSNSIRGLVKAQAGIGLEVGLLCSIALPVGAKMESVPGVSVVQGPHMKHYNPWFISRNWVVRILEEFGKPDLVHFHSVYAPFQTALARQCRQQDWPYIITPRGGMTELAQGIKHTKKRIANFLFFRSYVKNASAIHALCRIEAQDIDKLFETKKIFTVPNGVDDYLLDATEKLDAADLGNFGHDCDLMLGFVGRIYVYHKGLDLLLEAMAILKSQHEGVRSKLFVVGPFYTKHDERTFHSAIESLGLKNSVKILGPKYGEEKLRHFLACDVFVHTSRFEGMPMAVLEAMALGRPCLVTPGTNMADVVREGGGWECRPNPESICEAIKSIYEKRASLKALGQQSRELMWTRFTWRKVTQRLLAEYAKL